MVVQELIPLQQLEYVSCALCSANNSRRLFYGRDRRYNVVGVFNVVQCRNCELIYINPRPTQEAVLRYYPEEYRGFSRALPENRITKQLKGILKRSLFKRAPQWMGALSSVWFAPPWLLAVREQTGRVLDVGCGEGRVLSRLKQLGWQTYGVELDPKTARYVADNLGLDVFCGQLEEARFPTGYFDLVVFHHSLEHLPHPLSALRETHRVLKERGEVIVEVPNARSFQARLFKDRWVYWDVPRHLYTFSDITLRRMLIEAGFSTIDLEHVPATGGVAASLQYVWNDLSNDAAGRRIWNSRLLRTGLWPVASVLAMLGCGGCIRGRAIKGSAVP